MTLTLRDSTKQSHLLVFTFIFPDCDPEKKAMSLLKSLVAQQNAAAKSPPAVATSSENKTVEAGTVVTVSQSNIEKPANISTASKAPKGSESTAATAPQESPTRDKTEKEALKKKIVAKPKEKIVVAPKAKAKDAINANDIDSVLSTKKTSDDTGAGGTSGSVQKEPEKKKGV